MSEDQVAGAELGSNGSKEVGNDAQFMTRVQAVRNSLWVIVTRNFHSFGLSQPAWMVVSIINAVDMAGLDMTSGQPQPTIESESSD